MFLNNQISQHSGLSATRFSNLGTVGVAFIARTFRPVLEIVYGGQWDHVITVGLKADSETGKTRFCEHLLGVNIKEGPLEESEQDIDWTIGWNKDVRARISPLNELGTVVWMDAVGLIIEDKPRDPVLYRSNFISKYGITDSGGITLIEHFESCDPYPVIDCSITLKKEWDDFYFSGTARRTLDIALGQDVYESEPYQRFLRSTECLSPQLISP